MTYVQTWGGTVVDSDPPYLQHRQCFFTEFGAFHTKQFDWQTTVAPSIIEASNLFFEIHRIAFDFITTATVTNRRMKVELFNGADLYFQQICAQNQAPSTTFHYEYAVGGPQGTVSTSNRESLPTPLLMVPGLTLLISPQAIVDALDVCHVTLTGAIRF